MKKTFFAAMAAVLMTAVCFTGCDKSTLRDDASTRGAEPSTSLGDRIEQGVSNASERVSEGLSEAGSNFREGVSDASEAMSSIGQDMKD